MSFVFLVPNKSYEDNTKRFLCSSKQSKMKQRKMGESRFCEEERSEISEESTANGIPSLFRVQDCGSEPSVLNIKARRTPDTV